MKAFLIGGAGFIGSHLTDALVQQGHGVTVYDDLSVGRREWLPPQAAFIKGDALERMHMAEVMAGHDVVFHLSANPEARRGLEQPMLDAAQGTIATHNALDAARMAGVQRFAFASSGTVYGNVDEPCGENDLGSLPISLYGAAKLAGEALVSAYAECFGIKPTVLRFGNVVGPRGTHGCILDFLRKLKATPDRLNVLGDGRQAKPYLHVSDCVAGILHAAEFAGTFNLAPSDTTSVWRIAELCVAAAGGGARIEYAGGPQGWRGDVPRSRLNPDKLAAAGFRVRFTSDEAVQMAVREVAREVFG